MAALGGMGGGGMPDMGGMMGGLPSSSATSGTGDQTQNIGFTGQGVTFGGGGNTQLLIVGGVALALFFIFKK
ncbi:hypothetical protein [Pseudoalteromonas luteoviolacea]|nr:hypothetical protein [Pseudoalteromonas luteoviolacea]